MKNNIKQFPFLRPEIHLGEFDGTKLRKVRLLFRKGIDGELIYRAEFSISSLLVGDFADWFYRLRDKYRRRLYSPSVGRDLSLTYMTELKMHYDLKGFRLYTTEVGNGEDIAYRIRMRSRITTHEIKPLFRKGYHNEIKSLH